MAEPLTISTICEIGEVYICQYKSIGFKLGSVSQAHVSQTENAMYSISYDIRC